MLKNPSDWADVEGILSKDDLIGPGDKDAMIRTLVNLKFKNFKFNLVRIKGVL